MYTHTNTWRQPHRYVCKRVSKYTHIYIYTHTHTHIHVYTNTLQHIAGLEAQASARSQSSPAKSVCADDNEVVTMQLATSEVNTAVAR